MLYNYNQHTLFPSEIQHPEVILANSYANEHDPFHLSPMPLAVGNSYFQGHFSSLDYFLSRPVFTLKLNSTLRLHRDLSQTINESVCVLANRLQSTLLLYSCSFCQSDQLEPGFKA